jgi:hypothetical protein
MYLLTLCFSPQGALPKNAISKESIQCGGISHTEVMWEVKNFTSTCLLENIPHNTHHIEKDLHPKHDLVECQRYYET